MNKVYKYGLLPPIENADIVRDQIHKGHRYYNQLIEIERCRRNVIRNLPLRFPEVREAETSLALAMADLEEVKKKTREAKSVARGPAPSEYRSQIKLLKERVKTLRASLKEVRASVKPILKEEERLIEERVLEMTKGARALCGVFWGTYQLKEESALQASKRTPFFSDPRFSRWKREGAVSVQLQGGLEDLFGDDTRVRIANKERKNLLYLRVGSNGREPIFAAFPLIFHRPIPEGAVCMRATVRCRRIGPREKWELCLTLRLPDPQLKRDDSAVSIDVGWREMDGGLRVAVLDNGEQLNLSQEVVSSLTKADSIRAIRDRAFDKIKPDKRMRSIAKLAAIAKGGDDPALEAWRYQDYHLWKWEADQREKSILRRREEYRIFAAKLAERYSTLICENIDLSKLAKKQPEESDKHNLASNHNRHLASLSELFSALDNAFKSRGGRILKVDPAYTSRECSNCGYDMGSSSELTLVCNQCGTVHDRDANAAENIKARGLLAMATKPNEIKEEGGSAWAKRRARKYEKEAA